MTEELTIKVICTTMDEVEGSTNIRRMIHFTGEADCKNFKGRTDSELWYENGNFTKRP